MKFYKKSQGNILIIVLVILVILAGIVIVWNLIYPMITQKSLEADTSLFSIDLNIKEVILSDIGALKVSVQRGSGEGEINSLRFIFYDDKNSYTSLQNTNLPKEFETKTYFFSPFPNLKKLKSVSVVPVVNNKLGREFKFNSQPISSFPPGLVSWWRFDDNRDLVGRNNGINFVNLNNGNLILDGNNYLDIGNNRSLNMNSEFAISSWIKANAYGGKIISKGANYEVSVNPDNGKIRFAYWGEIIESANFIALNQWQHVVVSADWKAVRKIFINKEQGFVESREEVPILNTENALIGQGFNGEISDIMLFNKSLTIDNIRFLYNNQLG